MFTGLVQAVGTVLSATPQPAGVRLTVQASLHSISPGDSISVSGCCLTIAAPPVDGVLTFDIVHETLRKTTLGSLKPGSKVNLETSVTASTLMGGHFVQGHIDAVGKVSSIKPGSDHLVTIEPPAHLMPFMVPQGSICLDGVSLTIARREPHAISVALIPTTLQATTLGQLQPGQAVNIEADCLVKAVVQTVRSIMERKQ